MEILMNDNMTILMAFNIAMTIAAALGGWFIRTLFDKIAALEATDRSLTEQVTQLRVELPSHYVNKGDFKDALNNIFEMLRRIEDKLDDKVDR